MEIKLPFTTESAERFDVLFQLLSRKYKIEQNDFSILNAPFRIYAIEDIDVLLDELANADADDPRVLDERLPYWADIWPSALALSEYLLQKGKVLKNKNCLELGCGLGLAGIAAAKCGASVLVTDYMEDALRFAELNWMLNMGESPSGALLDWRHPRMDGTFEVIIASDVAYEKRYFFPLLECFSQLLAENGHIYLSEPNRKIAEEFFTLLSENGFFLKKETLPVDFRGNKTEISIYDITLKLQSD